MAVAPLRHHLGGHGGVVAGDDPDAVEAVQELAALADGLLVGVDLRDVLHLHAGQGQQLVADAQPGGADDGQIVVLEQLIHRPDGAVGAVLDGQHAELTQARLHGGHHRLEGLDIDDVATGQQPVAGNLGVGTLHALAGHQARLGEHLVHVCQGGLDLGAHTGGGGDQLRLPGPGQLKQGGEQVIGKTLLFPGLLGDLGQDGPLPLLVQDGEMVLVLIGGHLLGQVHALQEQVQQLVVHRVDLLANLRKFHDFPPIVSLAKRRR